MSKASRASQFSVLKSFQTEFLTDTNIAKNCIGWDDNRSSSGESGASVGEADGFILEGIYSPSHGRIDPRLNSLICLNIFTHGGKWKNNDATVNERYSQVGLAVTYPKFKI